MLLRRNSNDESVAQLASTGDTECVSVCTLLLLRGARVHASVTVRPYLLEIRVCMSVDTSVFERACLCVRPESKTPHLETALEKRVIDKY